FLTTLKSSFVVFKPASPSKRVRKGGERKGSEGRKEREGYRRRTKGQGDKGK
ncbi:19760_t:CDS:2, partial [Rhizophagus irregularis]